MIIYFMSALAAVMLIYVLIIRPLLIYWGATTEEIYGTLPGDELIPTPEMNTTKAIVINAKPSEIWPWIVQIGQGRAGNGSYDWVKNLFDVEMQSEHEILPHMHDLKRGDVINFNSMRKMVVGEVVPGKYLLLLENGRADKHMAKGGPKVSWLIYLQPIENGFTHLVSHFRYAYLPSIFNFLKIRFWFEIAGFIMERRMLLGIKEKAEYVNNMLAKVHRFSH